MKRLIFLAALILPLCAHAASLSLEDISPHLPANAQIIWKATNVLPTTLWTYKKQPQRFSPTAVSNALVLGAFELKPFPKSFTKPVTIWDNHAEGDPQPDYFALDPDRSSMTFRRERRRVAHSDQSPAALARRTWQYAQQMGLDKALLVQSGGSDSSTVSLARTIDGIPVREDAQGFSVQYGLQGEIRFLSFNWPKLERAAQERVTSPDEIVRCIRALKTPVLPANDEPDYFGRVKTLATMRTLTVTNITPYYSEGKYGEQPSDKEPENYVGPVAVLDAVADWGGSNAPVRFFSPLIERDVKRLLAQKSPPKH